VRRRGLAAVAILIGAIAFGELAGRTAGLHRPLLYEPTSYGYRVQPNQSLRRFGNRVFYDERGLRSEPVADRPRPGVLRVLCIGDSITNGGTLTDQPATYPYQLADLLSRTVRRVEVLNASAGGWALENEAGWLEANGLVGAAIVVLEVATHDLFQSMASAELVDRHPSFPSHPPRFALEELAVRYTLPRLGFTASADPGVTLDSHTAAAVERGLRTLDRIHAQVRAAGAVLVLLQIEQPRGREPTDEVTASAKAALRAFAAQHAIPLVAPAPLIEARGGTRLFRDGLHPNELGNRAIAESVAVALLQIDRPRQDALSSSS